ncbi:uncharacterized protein LOC128285429 [Gossypium arboreum]|uniref:uncharacterized protein LOC128285429 n=1 Tax=Gossypium arboreum TaxID=29729 RepID=UPI0022F1D2C9|nr:uncharacterized protein LOC128285429 [Gossypium arboreum]
MMHKEIEVYVNDMIARSRTEKEHIQVLRKLFLRLRKFQLKLNPAKCTFGAKSGKLLGFVVSEKGIKIDPDKVKAIQELSPPHTQKEVRGFLGRPNAFATTEEGALEELPWKLNFDRASNTMGNGIGAVLVSPNRDHYPFTSTLDFDCTNNMAKYEACIMGIRTAIEQKIKMLEVYEDSALLIYQLKGEWETRDPKLIDYRKLVLELVKEFEDITFHYLPRDKN